MGYRTKLTPALLGQFLVILERNGGIVRHACRNLNISRTALYDKRESDEKFAAAWNKAVDRGIDVLEDEAKKRAIEGEREPIYYQGKRVGSIMKKSDFCLSMVLRAHRAKYRLTRTELTGPEGEPLTDVVRIYLPDNKREAKKAEAKRKSKAKAKTKRRK